jgi:very-short-patch-repair endonuclease
MKRKQSKSKTVCSKCGRPRCTTGEWKFMLVGEDENGKIFVCSICDPERRQAWMRQNKFAERAIARVSRKERFANSTATSIDEKATRIYRTGNKVRLADYMRGKCTRPEKALFERLKDRAALGVKFQQSIALFEYIADFYCREKRLVVELDGFPHKTAERKAYDARRDSVFARNGVRVLRIESSRVFSDMDGVLNEIRSAVDAANGNTRVN